MKRVLITGVSGSGKSTVIKQLRLMGFHAVDADAGYVRVDGDGFQQWDEIAVERLLAEEPADILFFAGCEENMVDFLQRFDAIVLLSAPRDVLVARAHAPTNSQFGTTSLKLQRILFDIEHIEPRLRQIANFEINTDDDLDLVIQQIVLLT